MPKYLVERDIPGAGKLSTSEAPEHLATVVRGPRTPRAQDPVQSYVTDDRIYCVYIAPDEDVGREHVKQGADRRDNEVIRPSSLPAISPARLPARRLSVTAGVISVVAASRCLPARGRDRRPPQGGDRLPIRGQPSTRVASPGPAGHFWPGCGHASACW
jgi:hypothetical protein